jgi:hypothetical protein
MPRTGCRGLGRISLSLAGLALGVIAPLAAQAAPRVTRSSSGLWAQFYGNYLVASRWALLAGAQLRRADFVSEAEQIWLQLGLAYDATKGGGVTVGAGYIYLHTYPFGAFPVATDFPEHRAWQQLGITTGLGRVGLQQRFQLEQRWVASKVTRPDGREVVEDWVFSWRARSLFKATVPFRKRPIGNGDLYAAFVDEVFVAFGSNVGTNLFNQNRASALLGWQVGHGVRVETGYMNQIVSRGTNGNEIEIHHVLIVALYHSAKLH